MSRFGELIGRDKPKAAAPAPVETSKPAAAPTPAGKVYASPAVRRIAREFGVDLTKVAGTGRKNRILTEDVQKFVKQALAGGAGAAGLYLVAACV